MYRILLLFLILSALNTNGQGVENFILAKPAYPRLYNDENAYAYYHHYWRKLEDKLIRHQQQTGNQIVILSIATTGGYPIEDIALKTFSQWGIGDKETNTGLLVLIARNEQQIRIETGYGLEGAIPDITAAGIINTILKPALDSFNFILAPKLPQYGYLPAIEHAIDTLISYTNKKNATAIKNTITQATIRKHNNYGVLFIILAGIIATYFFIKSIRNYTITNSKKEALIKNQKNKKRHNTRSIEGQYLYPILILLLLLVFTIYWHTKWIYFIVAALLLITRWIYYLPTPKRRKEDIENEQQYYIQKKKYQQEYNAKKKILGSINSYPNHQAYQAKYNELGMARLEKALLLGNYAPKIKERKKKYGAGNLLYDFFLGVNAVEKKTGFSSTQTKSYNDESTGGQSASDYGGGSSGGGGANG